MRTAARYALAALLGLAVALAVLAYGTPREIVCDHPRFQDHPTAYAATFAVCNDGYVVVILD